MNKAINSVKNIVHSNIFKPLILAVLSIFILSQLTSPKRVLKIQTDKGNNCNIELKSNTYPFYPGHNDDYIFLLLQDIPNSKFSCKKKIDNSFFKVYLNDQLINTSIVKSRISLNEHQVAYDPNAELVQTLSFMILIFFLFYFFRELINFKSNRRINILILVSNLALFSILKPGFFDNDSIPLLLSAYFKENNYQLGIISYYTSLLATYFSKPLIFLLSLQVLIVTLMQMILLRFSSKWIKQIWIRSLFSILLLFHPVLIIATFTINRDGIFSWVFISLTFMLVHFKELSKTDKFFFIFTATYLILLREEMLLVYIFAICLFIFIFKSTSNLRLLVIPILISIIFSSNFSQTNIKRKTFIHLANYVGITLSLNKEDQIKNPTDYIVLEKSAYDLEKIEQLYSTNNFFSSLTLKENKISAMNFNQYREVLLIHLKIIVRNLPIIIKETLRRAYRTFNSFYLDWRPSLKNSLTKKANSYNEVNVTKILSLNDPLGAYYKATYNFIFNSAKYCFSILLLPTIILFCFYKDIHLRIISLILIFRGLIIIASAPTTFYKYHYNLNIFFFFLATYLLSRYFQREKFSEHDL